MRRPSRWTTSGDIEAGEDTPLLHRVTEHEKEAIQEMEEIGNEEGNPMFAFALQMSFRKAVFACILASIVWVPAIRKPFPNALQANIPLAVLFFMFMNTKVLGTTLGGVMVAITATLWACLNMWVMRGIFPGGMEPGMSSTSPAAIYGWTSMLVFNFIFLWSQCGMGMKIVAILTNMLFTLEYLNPDSKAPFSDGFAIDPRGTAVNRVLAMLLAGLFAVLTNLLPYPASLGSRDMKDAAKKCAKDTAMLFEKAVTYYSGDEASVVVESQIKHIDDLRVTLDDMSASIDAAWYEGFDIGMSGTIRALMAAHLTLMNDTYDRLKAMLIAISTEDFQESHKEIMRKIQGASSQVSRATSDLLMAVTQAASDGDVSEEEKSVLQKKVTATKKAVKDLAEDFHNARMASIKLGKAKISQELLGECFFVLTLSAYARLVCDYTDMMIHRTPQGEGFCKTFVECIKSTWDLSAMTDKFHLAFTFRSFIQVLLCVLYVAHIDGFSPGCGIIGVILMSPRVGPDVQATLNMMNSVILAIVLGTLLFSMTCTSGFGDYIIPPVSFAFWGFSFYVNYMGGDFAGVALLAAAISAFNLVGKCPKTVDLEASAVGLWGYIIATVTGLIIVSACETLLAVGRASSLAISSLDAAFEHIKEAFEAFWSDQDTREAMGPVAGHLGDGAGFNASAKIEPRLWKNDWKGGLYDEVVACVEKLRLDVLMLNFSMAGSRGDNCKVWGECSKTTQFKAVESDLNTTLADAKTLVKNVLSHETGKFEGLQNMVAQTGLDELGDMDALMDHLNKKIDAPQQIADSMEDDVLCQLSAALIMMDSTVKHLAGIIQAAVRNS